MIHNSNFSTKKISWNVTFWWHLRTVRYEIWISVVMEWGWGNQGNSTSLLPGRLGKRQLQETWRQTAGKGCTNRNLQDTFSVLFCINTPWKNCLCWLSPVSLLVLSPAFIQIRLSPPLPQHFPQTDLEEENNDFYVDKSRGQFSHIWSINRIW